MTTPDKIQYKGAVYVKASSRSIRIAEANEQLREAIWPLKKKETPLPEIPKVKTILPENRDAPQRTLAEVPLDILVELATRGVIYALASQNMLISFPEDPEDIKDAMRIVLPKLQERAAPEVSVEELQPDVVPPEPVRASAAPQKIQYKGMVYLKRG